MEIPGSMTPKRNDLQSIREDETNGKHWSRGTWRVSHWFGNEITEQSWCMEGNAANEVAWQCVSCLWGWLQNLDASVVGFDNITGWLPQYLHFAYTLCLRTHRGKVDIVCCSLYIDLYLSRWSSWMWWVIAGDKWPPPTQLKKLVAVTGSRFLLATSINDWILNSVMSQK